MKLLIVNAADYGYSPAIGREILEARDRGCVTSATLMVNGRYAAEAADRFVYHRDRQLELATLCDPRLRPLLAQLGIRPIGVGEPGAARSEPGIGS